MTGARFAAGRFRHNGRVALALVPALALVAGSADSAVLGVALVSCVCVCVFGVWDRSALNHFFH